MRATSTATREVVPGGLEIHGVEAIKGKFASFALRSTSYYPSQKVMRRIAQSLYRVDLKTKGLFDSEKYNQDERDGIHSVNLSSPLSMARPEGVFLLFLPENKPAYGLMDIRRVTSYRPDINLSLISPLALMPHELHVVSGGIYGHKAQFSVVDEDSSQWTLHCDLPS